jgi:hypothetical protein
MDRDGILDRWARRDAAKAIMADLGVSSLKTLYRIVAEARAMHDPRATYRAGRESSDRPTMNKRKIASAHRRSGRKLPAPTAAMPGWHFGKCSILVTTLGLGSTNCLLVPVSVSCVPSGMAAQRPAEPVRERAEVSRSLGEAMARHPLAGLSQRHGAPSQT